MKSNITFIIAAVLLTSLAGQASARLDNDGGASAYPRFKSERSLSNGRSADFLVNRPVYQR
jgi:hypothetical protein